MLSLTRIKPVFIFFLIGIACLGIACGASKVPAAPAVTPSADTAKASSQKPAVIVSLYMMSQCPYAQDLLLNLLPVIDHLSEKIALEINYIGTITEEGYSSMHGDGEVVGDLQQLCAHRLASDSQWRNFLLCQASDPKGIPHQWQACATETGIDPTALGQCVVSDEAIIALGESFQRSAADGVVGSPTLTINGQDYTSFRTPLHLSRIFCSYLDPEIPFCAAIPPVPKVHAYAITDARCDRPECNLDATIDSLMPVFPELTATRLDYSQQEARDILTSAGIKKLPAVLFDQSVTPETEGYGILAKFLVGAGPYLQLKIKSPFDPLAEICTNGIDDDSDGAVDCLDPGCREAFNCRKDQKNSLTLFAMSHCPYAAKAMTRLSELLEKSRKSPGDLSFRIAFIGTDEGGKLNSMHGDEEVKENIRQLCAQKKYNKKGQFLKYITCRNAAIDAPWENCATGAISAKVIEKCATGEEGTALLRASFAEAEALSIGASPSWLVNNKLYTDGMPLEKSLSVFCEANPGNGSCPGLAAVESASEPSEEPSEEI